MNPLSEPVAQRADVTLSRRSPSGVLIMDDFRDNLIVDRYDPILATIRGSKRNAMRSENSEDVLTWNCFRALRRVDPTQWLPWLAERAFGNAPSGFVDREARVELWRPLPPPPTLLQLDRREGLSEVDVVIETDALVWCIEAKYRSDISSRTTNDETRDQLLRNIDVGSYYAGVRRFYFSLLVLDEQRSSDGTRLLELYRSDHQRLRDTLPHRTDGLPNLGHIGLLSWRDIAGALMIASAASHPGEETEAGKAALGWLAKRDIRPRN